MNDEYDAIIMVGYRFENQWQLSDYLRRGLQSAATLYKKQKTRYVVVSGKWSLAYDKENITPPTTEAEEMKKILLALGVPDAAIIKEEHSKDTIGNAYYVKKDVVEPMRLHRLLVVCAQFHLERVRFIFNKVFGKNYLLDYKPIPVPADRKRDQAQQLLLEEQKKFFSNMKDGEDHFLTSRMDVMT